MKDYQSHFPAQFMPNVIKAELFWVYFSCFSHPPDSRISSVASLFLLLSVCLPPLYSQSMLGIQLPLDSFLLCNWTADGCIYRIILHFYRYNKTHEIDLPVSSPKLPNAFCNQLRIFMWSPTLRPIRFLYIFDTLNLLKVESNVVLEALSCSCLTNYQEVSLNLSVEMKMCN